MTPEILFRPAEPADALCLGVLSTQVFLDTYATHGIRRAVAFYPRCGYEELGMTVYSIDGEDFPNHLFGKRVRHVVPA